MVLTLTVHGLNVFKLMTLTPNEHCLFPLNHLNPNLTGDSISSHFTVITSLANTSAKPCHCLPLPCQPHHQPCQHSHKLCHFCPQLMPCPANTQHFSPSYSPCGAHCSFPLLLKPLWELSLIQTHKDLSPYNASIVIFTHVPCSHIPVLIIHKHAHIKVVLVPHICPFSSSYSPQNSYFHFDPTSK